MGKLVLNVKSLSDLKSKYDHAKKGKLDKFKFQGEFIVTHYAKYLIEYAESELDG